MSVVSSSSSCSDDDSLSSSSLSLHACSYVCVVGSQFNIVVFSHHIKLVPGTVVIGIDF